MQHFSVGESASLGSMSRPSRTGYRARQHCGRSADVRVTRVTYPEGRHHGGSLARVLRVKFPSLKAIFAARAERSSTLKVSASYSGNASRRNCLIAMDQIGKVIGLQRRE